MFVDCKIDKCKARDNKFGVTWCIKCGKLFTKPTFKNLTQEEIEKYNLVTLTN